MMKRRTFTFSLSALFAVPFLPATAAAPASAGLTQHFATAKLLARCHDRASPEMLARLMRLDGETAQGLYRMLIDRQVIVQNAAGLTQAVNPLNTHCVTNEVRSVSRIADMTRNLGNRLKRMRDHSQKARQDLLQDVQAQGSDTLDAPKDEG